MTRRENLPTLCERGIRKPNSTLDLASRKPFLTTTGVTSVSGGGSVLLGMAPDRMAGKQRGDGVTAHRCPEWCFSISLALGVEAYMLRA